MSDSDVRRFIYVSERDLWVDEDTGQPTNVPWSVEIVKHTPDNEDHVEYTLSSESETVILPNPETKSHGFRVAIRTPKGDEAWMCVWEGKHAFWERVII